MATTNTSQIELATFGAGCFWSTEKHFRQQFGANLISAVVGYMDDSSMHDCEQSSNGSANPVEVLKISYQRSHVTYVDLVRFFFHMHDPTISNRSYIIGATQYRSVIFTHTNEQQTIAEQIRDEIQVSGKIKGLIITEIQPVDRVHFHIAEEKHQNYLDKKYGWLMRS